VIGRLIFLLYTTDVMRQGDVNSFFKFVLGFTIFIAMSFGLTYAVTTYSIAEEREQQVGAAFQALLGNKEETHWWQKAF
jgi:hypothetical protein